MKLKKLLALTAASVMALAGLAGCGGSDSGSSAAESKADSAAEDSSAESKAAESKADDTLKPMKDISAWELVKDMKYGWNLGNTMDATGNNGLGNETCW